MLTDIHTQTLRLSPAAHVQLCPRGTYPWAEEARRQLQELGPRALLCRGQFPLKQAIWYITPDRDLAQGIQFLARRPPR